MAHNPITPTASTLTTVSSGTTGTLTIPPHREPIVITIAVIGGGTATVNAYGQAGALIQT